MNGIAEDEDPRTHYDRTSKTSRCLDYVMSSEPEAITYLTTDPERKATPYNIVTEKGRVVARKYTDHNSATLTSNS